MNAYLAMLREVYHFGRVTPSRAVLQSTGTKPQTRSLFGYQTRYDIARDGFPLVTTKHIPFRQVVVELLWFLRGDTNIAFLQHHGVKIWDQWADSNGELGPVYGKQWRSWTDGASAPIDQIAELLAGIRQVIADPEASAARRLLLTSWNPSDIKRVQGPSGCHTMAQFSVRYGGLSCHLYQRSADLFLGVPWNIACYALLTCLLAQATGLKAHQLIHSFGDLHIYENHLPQVEEQLERKPFPPPTLVLQPGAVACLAPINTVGPEMFQLRNYYHHPALKGEVAV